MIDNTAITPVTEAELLYHIDFNNLIKNSLPSMIEYLSVYSDYFPNTSKPSIRPTVGLSLQEQKILIDTRNNDHKLTALYTQTESSLEQTITDWANIVIKRYFQWLKNKYNKQRNLLKNPVDYNQLAKFIYYWDDNVILFDRPQLLPVVLGNLNKVTKISSETIKGLAELTKVCKDDNVIAFTILKVVQDAIQQKNQLKVNYAGTDSKESILTTINETIDEIKSRD